jgi:geranylgeranyl diphosphate synthase type I
MSMANLTFSRETPGLQEGRASGVEAGDGAVGDGATFCAAVTAYALRTLDAHASEPLRTIARGPIEHGGKFVRAELVRATGAALGAHPSALVPFAAACELLHNASLVHDDVQDGDSMRRGRPTVWAEHGVAQSITAGDLLLMLGTLAVDSPTYPLDVRWALSKAIARRSALTASGQSLELWLTGHPNLAETNNGATAMTVFELAAEGKTGHFFALPVEGAAIAAGRSAASARALGDATLRLGVIYQIRDDLLDLYGDKGRGSVANDLREGKFSALVAAHLDVRPCDRDWLTAVLTTDRQRTTDADIARVLAAFEQSGAPQLAFDRIETHLHDLARDPALAAEPALRAVIHALAHRLVAPLRALDVRLPPATAPHRRTS